MGLTNIIQNIAGCDHNDLALCQVCVCVCVCVCDLLETKYRNNLKYAVDIERNVCR